MKKVFLPKGTKVIRIDWLDDCQILLCTSKVQYDEFCRKEGFTQEQIDYVGATDNGNAVRISKDGVPWFAMVIQDCRHRTVVHECVHMVELIFKAKGFRFDTEDNCEPTAYMIDFLFQKVCNALGLKIL